MTRRFVADPFGAVKRRAVTALLISAAITLVLAGMTALVDLGAALDLFFGGLVVILPQWWLAHQLGSRRWAAKPALLAVAKYSLTGVGFAVLFALKQKVNGLAVITGAVMAIGVTPVAYHVKTRRISS